jgi:Cysteine-rich CWC
MQPRPQQPAPRQLTCGRCGAAFDCGLGGDCWCAAEPFVLPMPPSEASGDCLCPACLRSMAERRHA